MAVVVEVVDKDRLFLAESHKVALAASCWAVLAGVVAKETVGLLTTVAVGLIGGGGASDPPTMDIVRAAVLEAAAVVTTGVSGSKVNLIELDLLS